MSNFINSEITDSITGFYGVMMKCCIASFIKSNHQNSIIYKQWKQFYKSSLFECRLSRLAPKHPNNVAYNSMFGLELWQQNKYKECIKYLMKTHRVWKHPIITIALSVAYFETNEIETALQLIKPLSINSAWKSFSKIILASCEQPYIPMMCSDIHYIAYKCYMQFMLSNRIKRRWLKKCISHRKCMINQYLSHNTSNIHHFSQIPCRICHSNNSSTCIPGDEWIEDHLSDKNIAINVLHGYVDIIHCCYYLNSYHKGIKYITKAFNLCKTYNMALDAPKCRGVCLLLMKVRNYELFNEFVCFQLNVFEKSRMKNCKCCDNGVHCSDVGTIFFLKAIQVYSEYSSAFGHHISNNHLCIINEIDLFCEKYGQKRYACCMNEIKPIIGFLYAFHNDCANAMGLFIAGIDEKGQVVICKQHNNNNYLKLHAWMYWYLFGRFLHGYMNNLKKAKYCYKLALQCNPYDATTCFCLSLLMKQKGKSKLSRKYLERIKNLNRENMIYKVFRKNKELMVFENEQRHITEFDECYLCRKKGFNFKKCS
eukprot:152686_1